jgi:hypothetical protein
MNWRVDERGDPSRFLLQDTLSHFILLNRFQIYWQFVRHLLTAADLDLIWQMATQDQRTAVPAVELVPVPPPVHPSLLSRRLPI